MHDFLIRAAFKGKNLFVPPHNFREYRQILQESKNQGYRFYTLQSFLQEPLTGDSPYIILRHDIDSDPRAALLFAEIEGQLQVVASYYFRRQTWDTQVINTLHRHGHEIGYHYEEMTDFAKAQHLKDKESVLKHIPEIQRKFAENFSRLRQTVEFELSGVAAHGDFAWKRLDLGNRIFLKDSEFRKQMGIAYEAYDEPLVAKYRNHISDKPSPQCFLPESPRQYIQRGESFLFLSHPRWWHPNPIGNILSDIKVNYQKLVW